MMADRIARLKQQVAQSNFTAHLALETNKDIIAGKLNIAFHMNIQVHPVAHLALDTKIVHLACHNAVSLPGALHI